MTKIITLTLFVIATIVITSAALQIFNTQAYAAALCADKCNCAGPALCPGSGGTLCQDAVQPQISCYAPGWGNTTCRTWCCEILDCVER